MNKKARNGNSFGSHQNLRKRAKANAKACRRMNRKKNIEQNRTDHRMRKVLFVLELDYKSMVVMVLVNLTNQFSLREWSSVIHHTNNLSESYQIFYKSSFISRSLSLSVSMAFVCVCNTNQIYDHSSFWINFFFTQRFYSLHTYIQLLPLLMLMLFCWRFISFYFFVFSEPSRAKIKIQNKWERTKKVKKKFFLWLSYVRTYTSTKRLWLSIYRFLRWDEEAYSVHLHI